MSETERAYYSFQYSLFFTLCFEVLGGLLFLWATKYVVSDRRKAEEESSGAIGKVGRSFSQSVSSVVLSVVNTYIEGFSWAAITSIDLPVFKA